MKHRPACQVALLATLFVIPSVLSVTPAQGTENASDKFFVNNCVGSSLNFQKRESLIIDNSILLAGAPPPGAPPPVSPGVGRPDQSHPVEPSLEKPISAPKQKLPIKLTVSSSTPKQGGVVKLTVAGIDKSEQASNQFVTFENNKVKLFPDTASNNMYCLIGIPVTIKPGTHAIKYGDKTLNLKVVNAKYPVRNLRLPKKKNNFKATPGEKETIKKAKKKLSPNKLWAGKFQRPVKKSRISSVFGIRRRVNGKLLKDYFHSGTDFAAPRGTPIYACAKGKVLVAKTGWRLHGNTVCIDHGQGVISIYIHMNSINVKQGQSVKANQKIGAVGSTGRASGPHLHFGIYVNNTATDPMNWFAKAY